VFSQQFSALKGLIDRGEILKGVPYSQIRASATVSPSWIAARLHAALRKESATYLYGTWSEAEGIIGCTPERLCYYEQDTQVVTTEVVAGTKTLESYHYGALLNDPKAIREHTLVIEDLSERLSEFGAVEIGTTDECQVPGLVHLKTPLRVLVRRASISLRDVVQRLHPTAALGVYPRNSAGRAWLQEADRQLPRWRFGAPFGVSFSRDPENSRVNAGFSCLVAIRNVQWRGKLLCINAGCGVIESSQLEWEWQECLAKIQSIRNLLDL
jgi:menaquinone-specific isochorismate synthase